MSNVSTTDESQKQSQARLNNVLHHLSKKLKIKGILIDLNGTIHIGNKLIGNAKESLSKLTQNKIEYCFVTNNSKESTSKCCNRLKKLGIENISKDNTITASSAAASVIQSQKLENPLLFISKAASEEFEPYYTNQQKYMHQFIKMGDQTTQNISNNVNINNTGININNININNSNESKAESKSSIMENEYDPKKEKDEIKNFAIAGDRYKEYVSHFDGIIIGLSPTNFNYNMLNIAFHCLHYNTKCKLFAVNKSRYLNQKINQDEKNNNYNQSSVSDVNNMASGPFVAALEFASDKKATLIGKPSPLFFQSGIDVIMRRHKSKSRNKNDNMSEFIMIGDDARDDVKGAIDCGMKAILVKTGKYRQNDEIRILPVKPAYVAENFDAAVDWIVANVEICC